MIIQHFVRLSHFTHLFSCFRCYVCLDLRLHSSALHGIGEDFHRYFFSCNPDDEPNDSRDTGYHRLF